jgi:hypothetical protein
MAAAAAAAPATSPLFLVLFPDYEKSAGVINRKDMLM